MITELIDRCYTFRQRYPGLLPKGSLIWLRPWLLYLLDLITMNRGCKVDCVDKWPLRVEWSRIIGGPDFKKWEKEFIEVYAASLSPDDVVFDIGAEFGEWAALAATRTKGSRVHIFEPNPASWRHIRKIWRYNRLETPGGCWQGFVSDRTSNPDLSKDSFSWPQKFKGGEKRFESLLNPGTIPSITIDDYVKLSGAKPTVLMMDIEGSEILALEGAIDTLSTLRPVVFLSCHPYLISQFRRKLEAVKELFSSLGFRYHLIFVDHEEHWVFWDPQFKIPALADRKC